MLIAAALILSAAASLTGTALAQATTDTSIPDQVRDPLRPLKSALADAGAADLTTAQETAIETLTTDFQTAIKPTTSTARAYYNNYILAGDATDAIALIPTLRAEQATQELVRMEAEATFAGGVATVIQGAQLSALKANLADDEIVRLIQSLAGGHGGMGGPGGPGHGVGPNQATPPPGANAVAPKKK